VFVLGRLRLYECPLTYVEPWAQEVIRLVLRIADTNRLLFPGEWGDQPHWLVEAYDIYRAEQVRDIKKREKHGD